MLKSAEIEIKKEHQVLMVNKTTSFKKQGKSKGKFKKGGKKAATPPMKPKTGLKPDAECYYCKEKGHWKRNCSKYLADLKSGLVKKKKEGSTLAPNPGVAPHYIPSPSTFNVLLGSYWFDNLGFILRKIAAVRITPSSWGSQRTRVERKQVKTRSKS
ncbi:hypothetical protein QYE76_061487 [Lolium multiflorum]|uniref:CCHC-type domain-containing protein n=1 Tax=Lolium multiflorum TaxID=4521 RepID=A0AAD8W7I2_LOLMU|nr:hypothetical protein QYE76_061487 [Lolium multiflorum]